ncbi:MAG: hypothetical protein ACFB14_01570 [Leptolyngbyaceae cyanobacterium]
MTLAVKGRYIATALERFVPWRSQALGVNDLSAKDQHRQFRPD